MNWGERYHTGDHNPEFFPRKVVARKPAIYLYPQVEQKIKVLLNFKGKLTFTFPEYKNGWDVIAFPNGTIKNVIDNSEFNYLFWEGHHEINYDFSKGFVVENNNLIKFFQDKLKFLGLNDKEMNEFIIYWVPIMQKNKFNLITFQTDLYTKNAELIIDPKPDSLLRVFMVYKALNEKINLPEQKLEKFERKGFSVIEWGGTEFQ